MGWLQRHAGVIVISGIVFLVLSLGAGTLFGAGFGTPPPPPTPTPAPAETPDPDATPTPTPEPEDDIQRTYEAPPEMMIDPERRYEAIIHLRNGGAIRLELYADEAPGYVNNFAFLAEQRFYEGLTFHRVEPGFVIQGGDPEGTGFGGPGYWLEPESTGRRFEQGVISMAKAGNQVSGSQFFITLAPTPHLAEQDFTVFGSVIEGFEHVQGVAPGDRIDRIEIIETAEEAD
jgi:cyclophilin family peptidyl-prolyl cis-trans isomerase